MKTPVELMALLEAELGLVRQERFRTGELYQPMDYILALGGKRIRPLLFVLAYQSVSGKSPEKALRASLSVELFHNFSLLHDDIMDNAPLRRGQPTVHEKWDTNTAILAGDAMFALAFEFLIADHAVQAAKLVNMFTRVSVGVCEGQMEDMLLAQQPSASIDAYIEMIRKKTAVLLGGSLALGAIAAGADAEVVDAFYAYGETAGIGFQLHDDYLDVFAGTAKTGKQVAGDILENKKTYLLLRAYEKANELQRSELDFWLTGSHENQHKIQGVMKLYEDLGIPADTQAQIDRYFKLAETAARPLERLDGFTHVKSFVETVRQRDH